MALAAGADSGHADPVEDSDAAARTMPRLEAFDWWYRCHFAHGAETSPDDQWWLHFDGLATIADVWLNSELVLRADNMFVAHAVDVTTRLSDHNEIVLHFHALDPLLAQRRPRPAWRAPMIEHQQLRWFRTTLLGRTPGWSPSIPPVGPWRSVYLERRTSFDVERVDLRTSLQEDDGLVAVTLDLRTLSADDVSSARLRVAYNSSTVCDVPLDVKASDDGTLTVTGVGRIAQVERWWPHTHGTQALYDVSVVMSVGPAQREIAVGRTGFRDLTLNTAAGAFELCVNGATVFCRGACWMPLDAASLTGSADEYRAALERVRDAGMNMLRVVGSTVYETAVFHDLCDELGILVWQDFMFANMEYPEAPPFRASAEKEVRQALRLWQARPSMAVLCGNSEGEQQAAMWGAPRSTWSQPWFSETLRDICAEVCPDIPYWPSSSSGGAFPHQPDSGTSSYYGVGAYLRPVDDARRSDVRFASECLAFANVPEDAMLARLAVGGLVRTHTPEWKAGVPRDLGAGWDFEDVRDHYLRTLFGVDPVAMRSIEPDRYLALSRIVSGEVMFAAFSEWRRAGSRTTGALVWFLRDLMPGAGWGVIDSSGTPKAAFYYLRRILSSVTVFFTDEGLNGACVHIANDGPEPWTGDLRVQLFRNGEVEIEHGQRTVSVAPRSTFAIGAATLFDSLPDTTYAYRFGAPSHDLVVASLVDASGCVVREAFHFPVGRPSRQDADLGVSATALPSVGGDVRVTLRTRRLAQAVSIDVPGFEPDDNYFHVAPGGSREVTLRRTGPTSEFRGGRVLPLNATAGTRIVIQAGPSASDTTQR